MVKKERIVYCLVEEISANELVNVQSHSRDWIVGYMRVIQAFYSIPNVGIFLLFHLAHIFPYLFHIFIRNAFRVVWWFAVEIISDFHQVISMQEKNITPKIIQIPIKMMTIKWLSSRKWKSTRMPIKRIEAIRAHRHTHKRIEKNVKQSLALNAIGDSSCDEKSFPIKKVQSPSNSSLGVCVCDGNIVA